MMERVMMILTIRMMTMMKKIVSLIPLEVILFLIIYDDTINDFLLSCYY